MIVPQQRGLLVETKLLKRIVNVRIAYNYILPTQWNLCSV